MTAQELKERLTETDIKKLLTLMNATFYFEDDEMWITDTICHHGTKPKLYYYKDSKLFHCYTECGQIDIISVVIGFNGFDEKDIPKAINWICIKLNINDYQIGFGQKQISDWEFINDYKKSINKMNLVEIKPNKIYNEKILNIFRHWYTSEWEQDGISIESMKKYNILYCVWQQKIIIPHYDISNNLIGIRNRALLEEDIELFGKYQPFRIGNYFYNHKLGMNLYGLNKNIKAIQGKSKIMLVESEKSVLQTDTMFGDDNFTVALCGCHLTQYQIGIIIMLGIREVIVALDKQYTDLDSEECKKWAKHIKKNIITPLAPYLKVSVLWDTTGLLDYKDSPTDKGLDILLKLMDTKIYVGCNEK